MKGAVAAGHELTAHTAAEVLRSGGNAFDAAVAAFFTMCMCEPVLASLGGGGFLLARDRRGQSRIFDFFTHTPRRKSSGKDVEFYPVTVDFGSAQQVFHIGLGASATPGAVSGMFSINTELGSMSMRELIQPAVDLAHNGVVVNEFQSYLLQLVSPIYMTGSMLPLFSSTADHRQLAASGELIRNPDLAQFLEILAIEGSELFYRGEIARDIQRLCEGRGHLGYEDFTAYHTIARRPLSMKYRDRVLYTNPPPGAGGILIAFGLSLLQHFDLPAYRFEGYDHLRLLAEVLVKTSAARARHFVDGPDTGFLDADLVAAYRQEVHGVTAASKGTTHISVVDGFGNMAAMTVSNGEGCGELVPGTGIIMNNMLGEEDLNPGGFHGWRTNERMSSMMAPCILLDKSGGASAFGSGGSNRIRTAILQVVSNMVDFGLSAEAAITNPRIHIETDVLNMESGFRSEAYDALGEDFPQHRLFEGTNMFFGGVHSVSVDPKGRFSSTGDPRRSGVGLIV